MPTVAADGDYKKLFTELIKKQMLVLGPDITLARVKNVAGVEVNAQGEVTSITGDPQVLLQGLINQFVELSGLIVKKTMESILTNYAGMTALTQSIAGTAPQPPQMPLSTPPATQAQPQQSAPAQPQSTQQPVQSSTPSTPPPANLSSDQVNEINKLLENMNKAS